MRVGAGLLRFAAVPAAAVAAILAGCGGGGLSGEELSVTRSRSDGVAYAVLNEGAPGQPSRSSPGAVVFTDATGYAEFKAKYDQGGALPAVDFANQRAVFSYGYAHCTYGPPSLEEARYSGEDGLTRLWVASRRRSLEGDGCNGAVMPAGELAVFPVRPGGVDLIQERDSL